MERLNDLVWDMRESYDEAGSKLVYEVIQAARANFPVKEPEIVEETAMQYAHRLIETAEAANTGTVRLPASNPIVNK